MNRTNMTPQDIAMMTQIASSMHMPYSGVASPSIYYENFNYFEKNHYNVDDLSKKFTQIAGNPITAEDIQSINSGRVVYNSYDIFTNYDTNHDGRINKNDLEALNFDTIKNPSPTDKWSYFNDSQFSYSLDGLVDKLEQKLNIDIDKTKLKEKLGTDTPNDLKIGNVFDTMTTDGMLSKDELSSVLSTPLPALKPKDPNFNIAYDGDGKWEYNVEDFAKNLEGQFETSIDRQKLRDILELKFSDRDYVTDARIYNTIDPNKDKKLSTEEIISLMTELKSEKSKDTEPTKDYDTMTTEQKQYIDYLLLMLKKNMMQHSTPPMGYRQNIYNPNDTENNYLMNMLTRQFMDINPVSSNNSLFE